MNLERKGGEEVKKEGEKIKKNKRRKGTTGEGLRNNLSNLKGS